MAEKARFFDSVASDRVYGSADLTAVLAALLGGDKGVVRGYLNGLAVTAPGGSALSIASGSAFIEGHQYENTAALAKVASANGSGSTRVDLVTVQLDLTNRTLAVFVHEGTPGAGAPAPTVTSSVIELPIYQFDVAAGTSNVSALTDVRTYILPLNADPALVGEIKVWPGSAVPDATYQFCRGASLLRADYPALFAIIGTTYGAADGTHFTLPNLQERFPVGAVSGGGTGGAYDLGDTGGAATVTLDSTTMPAHVHAEGSHTHDFSADQYTLPATPGGADEISSIRNYIASGGGVRTRTTSGLLAGVNTASTGSGSAHENRPPFLALNFVIKALAG